MIIFIFRLRPGGFGQAAALQTFGRGLLAWSPLFLSPSHSNRFPTSRGRRPSLSTRVGEAWRRTRTRRTTCEDGRLIRDQSMHLFSGCFSNFSHLGPNGANCCQRHQTWRLKRLRLISYNLLTSSELRSPTNRCGGRQRHAEHGQQVSHFCVSTWDQMADNRHQSCFESAHCVPALLPSDLQPPRVCFDFLMPHSLSQSRSLIRTWLSGRVHALMRQREEVRDGTGGDKGERGRRGWMEERSDELSGKHKEGLFCSQKNWP